MQKAILEATLGKERHVTRQKHFYWNKRTRYQTGIRENTIKFYIIKHSDEIFDKVTTAITQEMQTH